LARGDPISACPDRAFTILEQRLHRLSGKLRVKRELSILPAGESLLGADPKRSIASGKQARDMGGGQRLLLRLPGCGLYSGEANQTKLRTEPKIAVRRLSYRIDIALAKAVAALPGCVCVLADIQRRIQRKSTRDHAQDGNYQAAARKYTSASSIRPARQ